MSNVKLMRGEGNLATLRGVQILTRDTKRPKTWKLNHTGEVVDKYPEYGEYYMDGERKMRVTAVAHEKWGMDYYSNALQNYLQSDDTDGDGSESMARYAIEQVLTNDSLNALMQGAQYVPKLVVSRVQSASLNRHIGVYTLKSIPRQTKFDVKRSDFGYMKSWAQTRFIDSQMALDYLAFLDKYEVLIAEVSLKLKKGKADRMYEHDKRDLEYAVRNLERRQKAYAEWLLEYDDMVAKWVAQEAWLNAMPDHLPNHEVGRQMRYSHGAVDRNPADSVGIWDREIDNLTKNRDTYAKRVKDYEDAHGGEQE